MKELLLLILQSVGVDGVTHVIKRFREDFTYMYVHIYNLNLNISVCVCV